MLCFLKERHIKVENTQLQQVFFIKSDISENSKVCYGLFLLNGPHEGCFYNGKSR